MELKNKTYQMFVGFSAYTHVHVLHILCDIHMHEKYRYAEDVYFPVKIWSQPVRGNFCGIEY